MISELSQEGWGRGGGGGSWGREVKIKSKECKYLVYMRYSKFINLI